MTESAILLGLGLLCSVAGALLTLHVTGDLMNRMEVQNQELTRVSWQMLENQETTARRFSHELHDELGQTLAAVKANLSALRAGAPGQAERLRDCLELTDQAISNVREMSQLLRPTILDDFGLGASLRWLSEGFMQRTGIEVDCEASFSGRLADETETHLFRIAQEALTNAARHSHATRMQIRLSVREGYATLKVQDNGRGIEDIAAIGPGHLGLIGMRARARSAGGEMAFRTGKNQGLAIEVKVPARAASHEQTEDTHFVS
jgi:signal transduction histidine kinase